MLTFREYQPPIIDEISELIRTKKATNALLIAGCGTGKSIMAAAIAKRAIEDGKRVVFVCDLRVLPTQMLGECEAVGLSHIGLFCAGHAFDKTAPFIIAMAQTMRSRFKEGSPDSFFGEIDLLIFDEAHQSRYSAVAKLLREFYSEAFDLGLTATPTRTKNTEYLGQFYSHKVLAPQTQYMVDIGAVLPERVFCPALIVDESQLEIRGGEYTDDSQAKQTNTRASIDAVIDGYFKHSLGIPFAAYCVNLEHARLLTEAFNDRLKGTEGYEDCRVEFQSGSTQTGAREITYFSVEMGRTLGICSVGTMAVGFNLPAIGTILWCRKTMSEALYRQSVGRGCRTMKTEHPAYPNGKNYYHILDYSGDVHRFGLPSDHRIFDIGPKPPAILPDPKICPKCLTIVSRLESVCPNCGFEFPKPDLPSPNTDVPEERDIELTEIFSGRSKKERKFLRNRLVELYKSGGHPQRADIDFKAKFRYDAPLNWYRNLMFGTKPTTVNQMYYWSYLGNVEEITSATARSALFIREFGFRFCLDPYEILGHRKGENIQKSYQRRLALVNDAESLSVVRSAYEVLNRGKI